MTSIFAEQDLEPWASEYIRERLLHGNSLAAAALATLPLQTGRIATYLPRGTVLRRLEDFRTGGKLPTPPISKWSNTERGDEVLLMIPIPNTDEWLAEKMRQFLGEEDNRACIFEDAVVTVGDPILQRLETKYATLGKEVYHLVLSRDIDPSYVRKVLRRAKSIPTFIGLFTEWQGGNVGENPVVLSKGSLQAMASRAHQLVVGAFDGEGYLIWTKPPKYSLDRTPGGMP